MLPGHPARSVLPRSLRHQQGVHLGGRQGGEPQPSLALRTAQLDQLLALIEALDAFGDDGQSQGLPERDQGPGDRRVGGVVPQTGDIAPVKATRKEKEKIIQKVDKK